MIYQPRNVQPSSNAIDVSRSNVFSMEIQTSSYVSAYQLSILDFNNNVVYTGTKTSLSSPVYNEEKLYINVPANTGSLSNGNNYKWRVKLYQPTSDMIITYGNTQGTSTTTAIATQVNVNIRVGMTIKIGSQTRTISAYNASTGIATVSSAFSSAPSVGTQYYILSDFIETTPDYIIYARTTPSVSINNVPSTLTLKYHTFNGVYSQNNNVPITYHQFDLFIMNENGDLVEVDSSGKVYSAKLKYTYDGFRTGNYYYIRLTVENDLGVITTTDLYQFFVGYEIIEYLQQPVAQFEDKTNSIKISWVTPVEHEAEPYSLTGESTGFKYLYNTPYSPVNSLYTDGYVAEWKSEDGLYVIPEEFNITTQFSPDSNFYTDISGVYTPIRTIIEAESEAVSREKSFKLCLDDFNVVYLTPLVQSGAAVSTTVVSAPSTEDNTYIHIYVKDNLNYMSYPYIYFSNRDYIAKVKSYNSTNKLLTVQCELPFSPSAGEKIMLNNSLVQPLYLGTNDVFVLTATGTPQINDDYVWKDEGVWNDSYVWTEGGTSLERVCNHWWKVQITNDTIRTEEVYPSA